jgi:hypothetical protein
MKTITIPEYKNPFIVVINNNVYQYKGGETIEVPDEVAEAIEDALELVPKPKRYLSKFAQFVEGNITEVKREELDGITKIFAYMFFNYESLKSVEIPDSVTALGFSVFYKCPALKSVVFGRGISTIGNNVLAECTGLQKVTIRAMTPPTIQEGTFANVPTTCVFKVPSGALSAYKSASGWSKIANRIVAIEE